MIPKKLKPGKRTVGLLYYLYGRGRANEHQDPHLVAAWAMGVRDPGRDSGVTMAYLAALLDAPVAAMPARATPGAARVSRGDPGRAAGSAVER